MRREERSEASPFIACRRGDRGDLASLVAHAPLTRSCCLLDACRRGSQDTACRVELVHAHVQAATSTAPHALLTGRKLTLCSAPGIATQVSKCSGSVEACFSTRCVLTPPSSSSSLMPVSSKGSNFTCLASSLVQRRLWCSSPLDLECAAMDAEPLQRGQRSQEVGTPSAAARARVPTFGHVNWRLIPELD